MQERYSAEPACMALNKKMQRVALKILFSKDQAEKAEAQAEWDKKNIESILTTLQLRPLRITVLILTGIKEWTKSSLLTKFVL